MIDTSLKKKTFILDLYYWIIAGCICAVIIIAAICIQQKPDDIPEEAAYGQWQYGSIPPERIPLCGQWLITSIDAQKQKHISIEVYNFTRHGDAYKAYQPDGSVPPVSIMHFPPFAWTNMPGAMPSAAADEK